MRFIRFEIFDCLLIIIYTILILDLIYLWNDYSKCTSPMNLFLLVAYISALVLRLLFLFVTTSSYPLIRNIAKITIFALLTPFLYYWTILGIIWEVSNQNNSSQCYPTQLPSWLNICWIIFLGITDIILVIGIGIIIYKEFAYIRTTRRIMQLLNSFEAVGIFTNLLNGMNGVNGDANGNNSGGNEIGLTEEERMNLPHRTVSAEYFSQEFINEQTCTICTENYINGDKVIILPGCQHLYHTRCIDPWLIKKSACPNCRSNIRENLLASSDLENMMI